VTLLQCTQPGYQYCFDYRTYGPVAFTTTEKGRPEFSSAHACATAFCRTRDELNKQTDNILARLQQECEKGIKTKKLIYEKVRPLIDASSKRALTADEIDSLRSGATQLRQFLS
jgi:hypothetical protein